MPQVAAKSAFTAETVPVRTAPVPKPKVHPTVSVIIVSYFTGPLLWRSLNAALHQPGVKEVIVVDNGNWPATIASLVDMAVLEPRLQVVTGQGNLGFAAGCNFGASVASGEEYLLLNPDAILPDGAVAALKADGWARSGQDNMWLIGGRLINGDGSEQAGARRGPLTPWTALVEMLRLDRFAPKHPYFRRFNNHHEAKPEKTIDVPCISGACMMLPKAAFNAIGGMDEAYFLHAEDVDFCLRFSAAGGKIMFNPSVDILHLKSSSRTDRIRVERLKAQSVNRYFCRHFKTQYPKGFVAGVCALVWVGWSLRASRIALGRVGAIIGLNRRRGAGRTVRALRTARRMRDG